VEVLRPGQHPRSGARQNAGIGELSGDEVGAMEWGLAMTPPEAAGRYSAACAWPSSGNPISLHRVVSARRRPSMSASV